jgi:hypothetical protein
MIMQFEQQTITVRSSTGDKEGTSILAMVAVESGLAYCPIHEQGPFQLIHVSSGLRLGGLVETEEEAQRWLESVMPLADWTQDRHAISSLSADFAQHLQALRNQVTNKTDEKLKSLLSPSTVKALKQEMVLSGFTLREIIEYAIDMYLDTKDDEDESFLGQVEQELHRACMKYPSLHSLHEAYAVILEEVDELKAEVWKKDEARDHDAIRSELVQIAAMCARTEEDLL